jgi:protein-L-isoaspartate(D-aspartate) O-methyltransferase
MFASRKRVNVKGRRKIEMTGGLCLSLILVVLPVFLFPGAVDPSSEDRFTTQRNAMVQEQIADRGVEDLEVLKAMRTVPRHLFVPEGLRSRAYDDGPLPIGHGQTISQPYIVAYMTEVLKIGKGDTVLEIGTGSGYQAAVLSPIVKRVYTMEIIPELAASSKERLKKLGYSNVEVKEGDGYHGWPEKAPFDAIIVTAAAGHIPPPLIKQLKNGGRMVIPVGGFFMVQNLVLVSKDKKGEITTQNLLPVRFVPLTGGH